MPTTPTGGRDPMQLATITELLGIPNYKGKRGIIYGRAATDHPHPIGGQEDFGLLRDHKD